MDLKCDTHGETVVLEVLENRIDASAALQFKESVRRSVDLSAKRVILNLHRVDFIDSSGLGAIVAAMKLMGKDRSFELVALTPTVQKVFTLTRMNTIFDIHDTLDTALAPEIL